MDEYADYERSTCERCEENYDITADWDDDCYCSDCAREEFPEYWELMTSDKGDCNGLSCR